MNELSSNHETDSENSFSVFDGRSSDEDSTPANDRSSKTEGYKAVPPPITGNFLTPRADISFAGLDEYAIRNKIIESQTSKLNNETSETTGQTNDANIVKPKSASKSVVSNPKINRDRVIIEDWTLDDEEEVSEVQIVRPETQTIKTRDDKSGQTSKKQGIGFRKVKACFVCKSTDYLIKDYNFNDKKSQDPKLKNVVNTDKREGKPMVKRGLGGKLLGSCVQRQWIIHAKKRDLVTGSCQLVVVVALAYDGNNAYLSDYEALNRGLCGFWFIREQGVYSELMLKAMDDVSRQAFEEEKRRIASQKKEAKLLPNVVESSLSILEGGKIPIDASTLPNADLPIDQNML
ncbi:hypothetical protein Tco_0322856 [Tanacetum coccineum]